MAWVTLKVPNGEVRVNSENISWHAPVWGADNKDLDLTEIYFVGGGQEPLTVQNTDAEVRAIIAGAESKVS